MTYEDTKGTPLRLAGFALCLSICIAACNVPPASITPNPPISPAPSAAHSAAAENTVENTEKALSSFAFDFQQQFLVEAFKTQAFQIQALNSEHETILQEIVFDFESDMENGETDDYYTQPDFSIQLFAGSEGSYFQSPEVLANLTHSLATYAQALVIYNDLSYDVFKGQYIEGKFYFNGAETLPEENSAYLVTLNNELETQVFSGSLSAFGIQSIEADPLPVPTPTAEEIPEPTPTPTPTPEILTFKNPEAPPKPPAPQRYALALNSAEQLRPEFQEAVQNRTFRPPPPPPPELRGQFPAPPEGAPPPGPDGLPPPPPEGAPPPNPDGTPPSPPPGAPPPGPDGKPPSGPGGTPGGPSRGLVSISFTTHAGKSSSSKQQKASQGSGSSSRQDKSS